MVLVRLSGVQDRYKWNPRSVRIKLGKIFHWSLQCSTSRSSSSQHCIKHVSNNACNSKMYWICLARAPVFPLVIPIGRQPTSCHLTSRGITSQRWYFLGVMLLCWPVRTGRGSHHRHWSAFSGGHGLLEEPRSTWWWVNAEEVGWVGRILWIHVAY